MTPLYIGVDAGGSHCRARLTDAAGTVLGTGQSGPANTRIGVDLLHERLLETCMAAVAEAGLGTADLSRIHAGMGIAGINRMGMKQKLREKSFPFASLSLTSDAVIANLGAHMGADGATLIIGTGSVGIIKLGEDSLSIGGYGFPISDEGSGAALGLSAIRHALRALDGRTKPTSLSHEITKQFDHVTSRVVAWMDEATPTNYASFAPLVMDYAENGDEIALSIVREGALHVERFIETIFAKGAPRCCMVGGLSARMKPWLRARIASQISEPLGDALDGALLLAGRPLAVS
jgi:glucosamine kinase